jgi:endonuclease YncB( thermonuclease family)
MNGSALQIKRNGADKYGRTLVTVLAGGKDVGQTLVDEHLARLWPNGAEWWCD